MTFLQALEEAQAPTTQEEYGNVSEPVHPEPDVEA